MGRKKMCKEKPCLWGEDHTGPHSFPCKHCEGKGIVPLYENWGRCPICKGRGWHDVKKRKA